MDDLTSRKGIIDVAMWERLASLRIPGEVHQVLYVVLSKTYGYGMNKNFISNEEFVALTGLGVTNVLRSLKKLQDMGIISKEKSGKKNYFTIVKNCQKWQKIINIDNSAEEKNKNAKNDSKNNSLLGSEDTRIIKNDNSNCNQQIINIDNSSFNSKNNSKINSKQKPNQQIINIDNDCNSYSKINAFSNEYEMAKNLYYNNININNNNNLEINKKNSLINSTSVSKRLLGYFCALFVEHYGTNFKCNFSKDMAIMNRIFANYGEVKACYIIKDFFNLVDDPETWQYKKVSLEVLELSCNVICIRAVEKKKQQEQKKQIEVVENKATENLVSSPVADINFSVMMAELKRQYGIVEAYQHIEEYKTEWKINLQKLLLILSTIKK